MIFPMARTADDARLAVASTLYPPAGIRGVGPSLAAARWGISVMEYIQRANDEIVVVLLIETVDAVKNLDAILFPNPIIHWSLTCRSVRRYA